MSRVGRKIIQVLLMFYGGAVLGEEVTPILNVNPRQVLRCLDRLLASSAGPAIHLAPASLVNDKDRPWPGAKEMFISALAVASVKSGKIILVDPKTYASNESPLPLRFEGKIREEVVSSVDEASLFMQDKPLPAHFGAIEYPWRTMKIDYALQKHRQGSQREERNRLMAISAGGPGAESLWLLHDSLWVQVQASQIADPNHMLRSLLSLGVLIVIGGEAGLPYASCLKSEAPRLTIQGTAPIRADSKQESVIAIGEGNTAKNTIGAIKGAAIGRPGKAALGAQKHDPLQHD